MASNASNTGGYDCKFVETPPNKLVCQICLHVARNPHQVTCCGRVYCKACQDEHKRHSSFCPNCRETRLNSSPDTRGEWYSDWYFMKQLLHQTFLCTSPIGEQEIKSLKVMCRNSENGCGWVGELQSLDNHLTMCEYLLLRCTNKCMENTKVVKILRRDLDHHLKNKRSNHQYQCPHCKDTGRYCDISTTHLNTCPKVKVSCPNTHCKALVPHRDLANHRSQCQYEVVSFKYAEIGCKEELLRKDLKQHENDGALHFQLAIETITEQQKKINRQQEEISELQEEMKLVKEEQKMMSYNIMAGQVGQSGQCVFKMPEYYRHKSSKGTVLHSTLTLEVTRCVLGWMPMDVVLLQALMSQCLPTSWKGRTMTTCHGPSQEREITITLLNQLEDENHHTRTILLLQDNKAGRVVVGERSRTGNGFFEFISYSQLDHGAAQYLRDDCLYFQIKVQAAKPMKPWLTCTV